MKSLYDPNIYNDAIDRIKSIKVNDKPKWGKMNTGQMLAHCAELQEVFNGKPLKGTPMFIKLFKNKVKKAVVSPKAYKKNIPTHPQYVQGDFKVFEKEKIRLIKAVTVFHESTGKVNHPIWGEMEREESGWAAYKHLDHHLTQFGK